MMMSYDMICMRWNDYDMILKKIHTMQYGYTRIEWNRLESH